MASDTVAQETSGVRKRLAAASTLWLEIQNGGAALVLGLLLLTPSDTFGTAIGYRMMSAWAPEPAWGAAYAVLGAAQVVTALADRVIARRIAASLLAAGFGLYAVAVFVANPLSAGWPVVAALALGEAVAWWQSRRVP